MKQSLKNHNEIVSIAENCNDLTISKHFYWYRIEYKIDDDYFKRFAAILQKLNSLNLKIYDKMIKGNFLKFTV